MKRLAFLKEKKSIAIILSIVIILLIAGISYATFYYDFLGDKNVIETSEVQFELLESGSNVIGVSSALPVNDKQGIDQEETFDFAVTSSTDSEKDIYYEVFIKELEVTSGYTKLDKSDVRVYLTDFDGNIVTGPLLISDLSNMVLTRGEHYHNKDNVKVQDKYKLRAWIDEEVDVSSWDKDTKLEYKFKIGVRTTDYVTPEECFDVSSRGTILAYHCGDKTEGSEKHYDLVIPKTFLYGYDYVTLNETDKVNLSSYFNISLEEFNQALEMIPDATEDEYIFFEQHIISFIREGGKLTTEKQPIGRYKTLNQTDRESLADFFYNMYEDEEMTKEEILYEIDELLKYIEETGDYEVLDEILAEYLESGGALTSKKSGVEPIRIGSIRYAFDGEGLKSVYMPDSIQQIAWSAFEDNNIVKVKLSNSLTLIAEHAFSNNLLTSVLLPNSVEEVEMVAFGGNDLRIVQVGTSTDSNSVDISQGFSKYIDSNHKFFRIINKSQKDLFGLGSGSGIIENPYGNIEVTLK